MNVFPYNRSVFDSSLNSTSASHICKPSSLLLSCLPNVTFCATCHSLLINHNYLKPFSRSSKFKPDRSWGVDPKFILAQLFKNQKVLIQRPEAPYFLNFRAEILTILEAFSRVVRIGSETLVLAMRLVDEVCTGLDFQTAELPLIALIALVLASKFTEHDAKILPLVFVQEYFGQTFSFEKISKAENIIFSLLGYNANRVTPWSFVSFYLSVGIISPEDIELVKPEFREQFIHSFEQTVEKICLLSIKKYNFTLHPPHLVAAATSAS